MKDLHKTFGVEHMEDPTVVNLAFTSLALAGEVGELSNIVKKIWRGNLSDQQIAMLYEQLDEEAVDVLIYFCMLIIIAIPDFDKAWDEKHVLLYNRFATKLSYYKPQDRLIERK